MKVLFVCSGNAHRSPLAEALLRKMRPDLEVDSAGLKVSIPVSEDLRKYLAEENMDQYLKKTPEGLEVKQLANYDLIIAMEQVHRSVILAECPKCQDKIIVWNIEDLGFMPSEYTEKIDNQIKEKVIELAKSLQNS